MKKELSIKRLGKSFTYAFRGVLYCFKSEPNMKIHIGMSILVIICSFIFKLSLYEWITVVLLIGAVISAEVINTAIEQVVDLVCDKKNDMAMHAKDAAAGFVLVLSIIAAIIGLIIFLPKLF